MIPDPKTRRRIVCAARKITSKLFPDLNQHAGCLYLTWAFLHVAEKAGLKGGQLYAGEAYWPCLDDAHDDGVSPNRFGYSWEPDSPQHHARLAQDVLPEMHIWAGFGRGPIQQDEHGSFIGPTVMVDMTTGSWPVQCRALLGRPWHAPSPPDHFWGCPSQLPQGVTYRPHREAGQLAQALLLNIVRDSLLPSSAELRPTNHRSCRDLYRR